jgi:dihydrofolate reductase
MRKIIWLMHVSLDGFVAGPNGEIGWIYLEDELFEDGHDLIKTGDTALYGRVTYELMESYWPTAANSPRATKHDIDHANWVNPAVKIVFSRSLKKADWQNTRIVKDHAAEEVGRLKEQPGKNMILFASPGLASTFMNHDLIDEYWFNINPIILGRGTPLFKDVSSMRRLELLGSKTYKNGVVNLHYGRS